MRLQEHEARTIFSNHGMPVPQFGVASTPEEALRIAADFGFPVVAKSQVLEGGRGKAGGIRTLNKPEEVKPVVSEILDLEIRKYVRKLVAGTHGRGAWEINLPGATGVGTEVAGGSSINLMLDPPFPNPLRGQTLLRFAARHQGPVSLDVYDVRGRHVSHIADLSNGDGIIRTTWWATEDVASGVYFVTLRAGGEQTSQRIVVAK